MYTCSLKDGSSASNGAIRVILRTIAITNDKAKLKSFLLQAKSCHCLRDISKVEAILSETNFPSLADGVSQRFAEFKSLNI